MDNQENIVSLMDDNGNEVEFEVIATLNVKDNEYAILVPIEDEGDDAFIFRIDMEEDGEEILVPIEDDDEFEAVREEYDKFMEED